MRAIRIAAWTLLALVVALAASLAVLVLTFDPAPGLTRLQAQVRRATGRDLTVAGPVRLRPSWPPELTAGKVALSNPPGDPRPAMATADEVRAGVAFRPLLSGHVELDVVLVRPALELDRANLRFTPEPPPPSPAQAAPSRPPWFRAELRRLRIEDGTAAFPDLPGFNLAVPEATVTRDGDGAMAVQARLSAQGREVRLSGSAGPGGWPLHAQLDAPVEAPGVRLASLTLDAPAPDAAAHLKADLAVRGLPLALDLASVAGTPRDPAAPLPFTLSAAAAGAALTVQGSADPNGRSGSDATVSARIPDLPALSPLAGTALPALGAVSLDGRVLVPPGVPGSPPGSVAIRSLRLAAGPGNLAGDVALRWTGTPSLRGTLTSSHLDVDAILAALPRPTPPAPPQAPTGPAPVPASETPPPARVIPDRAIDLAPLRDVDLDLTATLTDLVVSGRSILGLDAHATAGAGHARLDQFLLTLPAGRLTGSAAVDATASPPAWSLEAHGPGLHLDRLTDAVHGTADVDASLTAAGAATSTLAASLDGSASLRLLDGDIDNRLLAPLLDAALRAAHASLDLSGRTPVRCLLLPLTAAHGTISTPGLLLDTPRLRVEGEGTADLAAETLALQLRPTLLIGGGASVEAPVRLSGPFSHPVAALGDGSGRTGLRIGLGARQADPDACGPAVPAPAPSGKAADLLRGLFR